MYAEKISLKKEPSHYGLTFERNPAILYLLKSYQALQKLEKCEIIYAEAMPLRYKNRRRGAAPPPARRVCDSWAAELCGCAGNCADRSDEIVLAV